MINIYERKEVVDNKQEKLEALDEATQRLLPADILRYVIAEYIENEQVVVERLETFKMQPRQPVEELDRACHHYCGYNAAMGCSCIIHDGCIIICIGVLVVPCSVGFLGAFLSDTFCSTNAVDCCARNLYRDCDCCKGYDCAKTDYRLTRSACTDCAALCYDLTCGFDKPRVAPFREFGAEPATFTPRPHLNGPEAM